MHRRSLLKILAVGGATAVVPKGAKAAHRKEAPEGAVGMLYDSTRCIGCKTCVVACREANGSKPEGSLWDNQTELNANTRTVIKLYRGPGAQAAYVKQQCMHCIDPGCVSACMIGALKKREFGAVTWDKDLCVGCRYCQIACPFGVPKFEFNSAAPKIQKCELCVHRLNRGQQPACTEVCPRQAVVFGKRHDLLRQAHARIASRPGAYLDHVYGEIEAGGTQVLYLTSKDVSFEDLGLPKLGDESAPHLSESLQEGIYQGFATPAVLYGAVAAVVWRSKRMQHKDEEGGK
jgi:formate dehydrogenase iron-sulfur subunit